MISVKVPGSKSATNRALIISGLAKGKSALINSLECDDTKRMREALVRLGVKIERKKIGLKIYAGCLRKSKKEIHCGNSGTTMRFLAAVLATQNFESILTGNTRMQKRPIGELVSALIQLGAKVEFINKNGFPPLKITGPLFGGKCELKGYISSQFLSGLLIAAPLAQNDVEINIIGNLVSKQYVDITISMMRKFGVEVKREGYKRFFIKVNQKYISRKLDIEGDASSASYFWGLSLLTGEKIEVVNIEKKSLQPDIKLLRIFSDLQKQTLKGSKLNSGEYVFDCVDFPDGAMTLAVVLAFYKGKFKLTGLANLRLKECDRLHALTTELKKIGCRVWETKDGLRIWSNPENLHGAKIDTYGDHRIAMCFGMVKAVLPKIIIKDKKCVKKTYPNFWKDLTYVKGILLNKNIILTGMRGCGKTKLGAQLGRILKMKCVDTDEIIEKMTHKSVAEIVDKKGWDYFRSLENKAVKRLKNNKNTIISTGGGTLMYHDNANILSKNGKIFYLHCDISSLKQRLKGEINRPSLSNSKNFISELTQIYKKRLNRYKSLADVTIDVSSQTKNRKKDMEKKADKIISVIERMGLI